MSPEPIQAKCSLSEVRKVEDLQQLLQMADLGMYWELVEQLGTDYKIEVSIIVVRQKPISDNSTR